MKPVRVEGVVKRYRGLVALDGLSFTIPHGSVCALIGPNGSGKTTTFGVLTSLLHIDSGTVDLFGRGRFDPRRDPGRVSLMPQDGQPSLHATLRQSLIYYAELTGHARGEAERQSATWLERVGLAERADSRMRQLSHGMRQRFMLAQALLGEPDLILLDEPTSGLDPEVAVKIRELFVERRGRATVVVSSHNLSELEHLCDYAVILERGRAVRQGSMQSITGSTELVSFTLAGAPDVEALRSLAQPAHVEWLPPRLIVEIPSGQSIDATKAVILKALLDQQVSILKLEAGRSLEAAYLARPKI